MGRRVTTFGYGATVTLITRTKTSEDAFGNDVFTETQTDVAHCPVWPRTSTESTQGEDQTFVGLAALLPSDTNVTAIDAVVVDGVRYEVDGEPARFTSPFTNLNPGIQVNLTRVTG